jgi:hypothetical protein
LCGSLIVAVLSSYGSAAERPDVDRFLSDGRLQEGAQALEMWLETNAGDDQATFGLGMIQFVQTVERLAQDLQHYGLRDLGRRLGFVPFLRLPVPENPNPQPLTYDASREIVVRLIQGFDKAERTLAQVDAPTSIPIHLARVRLDMNGDGTAADGESLWSFYERLNRQAGDVGANADEFVIVFDQADAHWLRGYCHLLMGFGEFALAHDARALFERTAHVFFARPESPYPFLAQGAGPFAMNELDFTDAIAVIHLINFPVAEPARMAAAHAHLKQMLGQSRAMWEHALAETDNDREWIPNANQTSAIPNVRVNQAMIDDWIAFLDEAEALLDGRKLIPFWRGGESQGVNLRRVFLEPRQFDLVLWFQGSAAAPYLEQGELTQRETWDRLQRTFQGNFIGFAIWFN